MKTLFRFMGVLFFLAMLFVSTYFCMVEILKWEAGDGNAFAALAWALVTFQAATVLDLCRKYGVVTGD